MTIFSKIQITEIEKNKCSLELDKAALGDQIDVIQRRLEVVDGVAKQVGGVILWFSAIFLTAVHIAKDNGRLY